MTSRRAIGGVAFVTCVLGCNAIAGINDPIDRSSGTSTSGGTTSGGTTSGGTPTAGELDRFVGEWQSFNALQALSNCEYAQSGSVAATLLLSEGFNGTIIVTPGDDPACRIESTVTGDTATAQPGESCTVRTDSQFATYSYNQPTTFQLRNAAGTLAAVNINATVVFRPSGVTCDFQEVSTYTKTGQP